MLYAAFFTWQVLAEKNDMQAHIHIESSER